MLESIPMVSCTFFPGEGKNHWERDKILQKKMDTICFTYAQGEISHPALPKGFPSSHYFTRAPCDAGDFSRTVHFCFLLLKMQCSEFGSQNIYTPHCTCSQFETVLCNRLISFPPSIKGRVNFSLPILFTGLIQKKMFLFFFFFPYHWAMIVFKLDCQLSFRGEPCTGPLQSIETHFSPALRWSFNPTSLHSLCCSLGPIDAVLSQLESFSSFLSASPNFLLIFFCPLHGCPWPTVPQGCCSQDGSHMGSSPSGQPSSSVGSSPVVSMLSHPCISPFLGSTGFFFILCFYQKTEKPGGFFRRHQ